MAKIRRAMPLLILILLLAGCMLRTGSRGIENQNPQGLSQTIKIGETTRDDIQKEFGNPAEYSTSASGNQTWIYRFVGYNWFWVSPTIVHRTLYVYLDRNGKVSDYNLTESNW